jgi:hypothetical protein
VSSAASPTGPSLSATTCTGDTPVAWSPKERTWVGSVSGLARAGREERCRRRRTADGVLQGGAALGAELAAGSARAALGAELGAAARRSGSSSGRGIGCRHEEDVDLSDNSPRHNTTHERSRRRRTGASSVASAATRAHGCWCVWCACEVSFSTSTRCRAGCVGRGERRTRRVLHLAGGTARHMRVDGVAKAVAAPRRERCQASVRV